MAEAPKDHFSLPEQTLRTLSFCEPNSKHIGEWISRLHLVNLGESSRQLYHAVLEVNQLICAPDVRLKLLEQLRKPIHFVCLALTKHFLNRPLILPLKARKIARLALALESHLVIGYKIVINDSAKASGALAMHRAKKNSALAIHRGITSLTRIILTSCQLYMAPPQRAWYELHQFYLIAEANRLTDQSFEDEFNQFLSKTTIADNYKRALMLGCSRPNQMRQRDIKHFYEATEMWSRLVEIGPVRPDATFIVDLSSNMPPLFQDLHQGKTNSLQRSIDFTNLLQLMAQYLAQTKTTPDPFVKGITIPKSIPEDLVHYLSRCWRSFSERAFSRVTADKSVTLCVGFSATHYFLSGEVEFETQLQKGGQIAELNPGVSFKSRPKTSIHYSEDTWAGAFDAEVERHNLEGKVHAIDFVSSAMNDETETDQPIKDSFQRYQAKLVDTSPNGYCIKWQGQVPDELKTGEIVGVNEGDHAWSVGLVRWVNQVGAEEVMMGIELIAPGALPCGIKTVTQTKRKSEYMRALMLPALPALNQPAQLITPNLPFKEGTKVIINQYGETSQGLLANRNAFTANFSQFTFEPEFGVEVNDEDEDMEDLWPDI